MNGEVDFEALGRRAVACKHWRWLPGTRTDTGATCIAPARADGRCWWAFQTGGTAWVGNLADLPDLRDPATLGCLLALVREAYGKYQFEMSIEPRGITRLTCGPLMALQRIARYSQAEALIEALELAP